MTPTQAPIPSNLVRRLRRVGLLNPPRHQGAREQRRRLVQIRQGQLAGPVVTEAARYAAHGLIAPSDLPVIESR